MKCGVLLAQADGKTSIDLELQSLRRAVCDTPAKELYWARAPARPHESIEQFDLLIKERSTRTLHSKWVRNLATYL